MSERKGGIINTLYFGFPSDFDRSTVLTLTFENHGSAKEHTQHIDQYIAEEVRKIALYCPYESLPFHVHVLPFMIVRSKILMRDVQ